VDVLSNKRVAGTIILNLENGSKKFLIRPLGDNIEFVMTKVAEDMTGLASMLQLFKEEIQLDVTSINLVELTNAHIDKENLPLFVFEMEEKHLPKEITSDFTWAEPASLKTLWATYEIEGVPMF
jgi:hypothetical protein